MVRAASMEIEIACEIQHPENLNSETHLKIISKLSTLKSYPVGRI